MLIEITEITDVMNHIDALSAVIFDLDDTLYSEKDYVRSGYKAVAETLPQVENVEQKLWDAFEAGKPAIDGAVYSRFDQSICVSDGISENRGAV